MFYIKCFIKYICLNEDILCWANTWVVWAKPRMGCDVIRLEKEFPQQRCRSKQSARVKLVQQAASSELRALHRKLTRKFSMQILALCAILRAHLAYWIFYTQALRWHDWARFLHSEGGERDRERQITTVEIYQNLYFMATGLLCSLCCHASQWLHFWFLKQINRTIILP